MRARKKSGITRKLLWLVLIVVIFTTILNRQVIFDFFRGITYSPSVEMLEIRANLDLTPRGEFLFNASRPELNNEESFNQNCYSYNEDEAILGCYVGRKIYVYEVREKELEGINELTTAHELLHAVYGRMSAKERDELRELLEKVYAEEREILEEEINNYEATEQLEELYVRVGTEVKDLPGALEKHYATIFRDQDKIVSFYESYIKVFRGIEKELEELEAELMGLSRQIGAKSLDYENGVSALNYEINEFNRCANLAGCFKSDYVFRVKRNELLVRQAKLQALYDEINELVDKYNKDVDRYNNNVVKSEHLQNIINSHVRVEGI